MGSLGVRPCQSTHDQEYVCITEHKETITCRAGHWRLRRNCNSGFTRLTTSTERRFSIALQLHAVCVVYSDAIVPLDMVVSRWNMVCHVAHGAWSDKEMTQNFILGGN